VVVGGPDASGPSLAGDGLLPSAVTLSPRYSKLNCCSLLTDCLSPPLSTQSSFLSPDLLHGPLEHNVRRLTKATDAAIHWVSTGPFGSGLDPPGFDWRLLDSLNQDP